MADADRKSIENIFGEQNVLKWADLDNNRNTQVIQSRIEDTLADALEYLYSRLRMRYTVPFSNPPRTIKFLNALDAGVRLYDGRLIIANDPPAQDQVGKHRKQYKRILREILSGQLHLVDGMSGDDLETGVNYPSAMTVADQSSLSLIENCNCGCHPCRCHVHTCVNQSIVYPNY